MKRVRISQEQAARIVAKLPQGVALEDVRLIHCSGRVEPVETPTAADEALMASIETAGGPKLLTNGKPTIMRVVAWMVHEGVNKNRLAFEADDLGAAADRIRPPDMLPMDWNHSAFNPWSFDPKVIGVWYAADKRWDPKAKQGRGAYGILVQGIMWSWLFPEFSNEMLAEQERNGELKFSMACLPTSLTFTHDADGPFEIAHQPVFLTNSALDVPPADEDAVGLAVEGSDDPNAEAGLTSDLTGTSLTLATDDAAPPTPQVRAAAEETGNTAPDGQEDDMKELQEKLTALQAQLDAANEKGEQVDALQAEIAQLKTQLRIAELEQTLADAQSTLSEVETARDGFKTEAERLAAELTQAQEQLTAANAKLAEIDAAAQAQTLAARWQERLAALPESYRTALESRPEDKQKEFAAKWTAASDEEWTAFAEELQFAFQNVKVSYQHRSNNEGGRLPAGGAGADDIASLVSSIKR